LEEPCVPERFLSLLKRRIRGSGFWFFSAKTRKKFRQRIFEEAKKKKMMAFAIFIFLSGIFLI
jgi:hypothetical protein